MTNEEAVKVLEDMKVNIAIPKAAELQRKRNEAIDMAIEALSGSEIPNNSDTVSRQTVLDLWDKYRPYIATKAIEFDYELRQLPSVEPEPSQVARDIATIIENEKDMRVISERKTGRWIPITFSEMTGYNPKLSGDDPVYGHRCSACNEECIVDDSGSDVLSNFCPHCGAKMEVEHD